MYERDMDMLRDVAKAVYSGNLSSAEGSLDLMRHAAHSAELRELVGDVRRKLRPIEHASELRDPNPITLPQEGIEPGRSGLPSIGSHSSRSEARATARPKRSARRKPRRTDARRPASEGAQR